MLEFMVMAEATQPVQAADLVGRWEGALSVGGTALPLVIRVTQGSSGLVAVMDSPAQGAHDIPISGLSETAGTVRFAIPSVGGRFEGARSGDGASLTGAWSQGGASLPLILTRAGAGAEVAPAPAPAALERPQTPVAPFPYVAEDVTFANAGAGIELTGTLTRPQGDGPFPAVVLITGSGAQDRDQTILGHKPFAVWADALTRRGVAVLRYDDRGMGGSGGGSIDETTADFATDVRAAMAFLRSRPEVDSARLGLMGHSEGGAAALIAMSEGAPAAFVVMIAGPSVPGADILAAQTERAVLASGGTAEQAGQSRAQQARLMQAVVDNKKDSAGASRATLAIMTELGTPQNTAAQASRVMGSGWYRYFVSYDPAPAIRALDVPMLAIYGERDINVPAEQNAPQVTALKPDATVVVLAGLNHLMQHARTGLPSEYESLTETLAPEAIRTVTDWIVQTTGAE